MIFFQFSMHTPALTTCYVIIGISEMLRDLRPDNTTRQEFVCTSQFACCPRKMRATKLEGACSHFTSPHHAHCVPYMVSQPSKIPSLFSNILISPAILRKTRFDLALLFVKLGQLHCMKGEKLRTENYLSKSVPWLPPKVPMNALH